MVVPGVYVVNFGGHAGADLVVRDLAQVFVSRQDPGSPGFPVAWESGSPVVSCPSAASCWLAHGRQVS